LDADEDEDEVNPAEILRPDTPGCKNPQVQEDEDEVNPAEIPRPDTPDYIHPEVQEDVPEDVMSEAEKKRRAELFMDEQNARWEGIIMEGLNEIKAGIIRRKPPLKLADNSVGGLWGSIRSEANPSQVAEAEVQYMAPKDDPRFPDYHHVNFNNKEVDYKYSTPPAESFWLAFSPGLWDRLNHDRRLHRTVVAASAAKYVDGCFYHGADFISEQLVGTALKEKVKDWVHKAYEPQGTWMYYLEEHADITQSNMLHDGTFINCKRRDLNRLPWLQIEVNWTDPGKRPPVGNTSPLREVQNASEMDIFLELTDPCFSLPSRAVGICSGKKPGGSEFLELAEPALFPSIETRLQASGSSDLPESESEVIDEESESTTVASNGPEITEGQSDDESIYESSHLYLEQFSRGLLPGLAVSDPLVYEKAFSPPIRPKSPKNNLNKEYPVECSASDNISQSSPSTEEGVLSNITEEPHLHPDGDEFVQKLQELDLSMEGFDVYGEVTDYTGTVEDIPEITSDPKPEAADDGFNKHMDEMALFYPTEKEESSILSHPFRPIEVRSSSLSTSQGKSGPKEELLVNDTEEISSMGIYSHDDDFLNQPANIPNVAFGALLDELKLTTDMANDPQASPPSSPSSQSESQSDSDHSTAVTEALHSGVVTPADGDEKRSAQDQAGTFNGTYFDSTEDEVLFNYEGVSKRLPSLSQCLLYGSIAFYLGHRLYTAFRR
jgi:hypothetical protein